MRSGPTIAILVLFSLSAAKAADIDRYRSRREEVFEFVRQPTVTCVGDTVTVTFESRGFCDVAIAVEDAAGKMLRHVVSGLLGPNAPAPLQKNSKLQTVVWDGKNDAGAYVDDKAGCTIRVSLGLQPRFERNLLHSPYKPWGRQQPIVVPSQEGVYVFEGDNLDSIKLFNHEGDYVRTVYPFPGDKIGQVKGLRWRPASQDGVNMPLKEGFYQSTFLTSGYNSGYDAANGYGITHFPTIGMGWAEDAPDFPAATAMAVAGGRIALAGVLGINRLATDGTSGGLEMTGPASAIVATERALQSAGKSVRIAPRAAALSPDGKWLYLTGYTWVDDTKFSNMYGGGHRWLNGVLRMQFEAQDAPEVFVGTLQPDAEPGSGPNQLYSPTSVACDAQGNVYVADAGNDRVQVFAPSAKLIETIPVRKPVHVAVHRQSGELYVSSWDLRVFAPGWDKKTSPTMVRLGPAGRREKLASYTLPFITGALAGEEGYGGLIYRVEVDTWAETPTVWLIAGATFMHGWYNLTSLSGQRGAIKIMALGKDKLVPMKDFSAEAMKAGIRSDPLSNARQLLSVNPGTGRLHVMESRISSSQVVEIDPETGQTSLLDLPHAADDICFDLEGHLYLNAGACVTRYDPKHQREVPWDYGEERQGVGAGGHGEKSANAMSALVLPGTRPPADEKSFTCGFALSPSGLLALQCWNGATLAPKPDVKEEKQVVATGRRYVPKLYPGRERWGEVHVFDRHGRVRFEDAIPGLGLVDGVAIDRADNLYVLAGAPRTPDGKHTLNPRSGTLIKFKPARGKVITTGDKRVPVPLQPDKTPQSPSQLAGRWIEGAEWMYGGVGYFSPEWSSRFALDLYARSFVPEPDRFSVAVLDTNGNLIVRIGGYGNVDDGQPLIPDAALPLPRSIGKDEVALMHACYTGVQTDKRLFISDAGNRRIVSVKLSYAAEVRIALKDVPLWPALEPPFHTPCAGVGNRYGCHCSAESAVGL